MSTRTALPAEPTAHPLAELFPRPSEDEYRDLRTSIKKVGLIDPITLFEGQVLDGLSRLRACRELGIQPKYVDFSGSDPRDFVLGKNLARRHLNESQRAMLAANLVSPSQGSGKPAMTQTDARHLLGVGETIMTEAIRVKRHADPELEKMINDGELTVSAAAQVARLPAAEQKKVIAAGPRSVTAKASQLRKQTEKPKPPPPTVPGLPEQPATNAKRFDANTEEILRDLRNLAYKLTRYIQTSDGKRFEEYTVEVFPGWIDYTKVKLVDDGDGAKRVPAKFVALQPLYRLLVASARARRYPKSKLLELIAAAGLGQLDASSPPPEYDPEEMVEPESL